MDDLIRLDAATLGAGIAAGEISSVQLTRACLDQIAATDARYHAFLHVAADRALAAAAEVDATVAAGEDLPLLQAKLEELRRRADAVGDLFPPRSPPLDAGAADVRARPITDPRVAEEIARQDADIKKNLDMIAAIERMVGTI